MTEKLSSNSGYRHLRKSGFVVPPSVNASFEGAAAGRRLGGWMPFDNGPNRAISGSLRTLRSRCRQQIRDNPRASTARDQYVTQLIGTGLRPKLNIEDAELRRAILALWNRSVSEMDADGVCDFYGMQAMVGSGTFESGEMLARRRLRRLSDGLAVPMQVQLLEPDHFDDLVDRRLPRGGRIRMGIELSAIGRRVAYHLRREHPSDSIDGAGFETLRVPASQITHVYRPTRPGQLRGVPHLAPALIALYELDKYEDAELVRKQQAAMFVGAIHNNSGQLSPEDIWSEGDWVGERSEFYSRMGNLISGSWQVLAPGDDISFNTPGDVGANTEIFLRNYLRKIAAESNITYEQLTGDMEGVNFSSARVRLIDIRRRFEMDQQHMIAYQFCRQVWSWWLDVAVAVGRITIPRYEERRHEFMPEWIPDPFDYVNPLQDFMTDLGEVRAGFTTLDKKRLERQGDPETMDDEIQRINQRIDERDLVFDSDPRKTAKSGVAQKIEDASIDQLRSGSNG